MAVLSDDQFTLSSSQSAPTSQRIYAVYLIYYYFSLLFQGYHNTLSYFEASGLGESFAVSPLRDNSGHH